MKHILLLALFLIAGNSAIAQDGYPYPVHYFQLHIEGQAIKMAYMDVTPAGPNGKVVILLHGKNFNGYYWKDVAAHLAAGGYRVIIPDQVGWGKSDHPNIHYSFPLLAANNKALLDSLQIDKVIIIGHSMGGMLATRFTLMYPQMVQKLVLEDPIGLEDYKTFIPYTGIDKQYQTELAATYKSYKKYMEGYFPQWKPEYEELVRQQAAALSSPDFKQIAWANALTYEMIYEQPVCYEFKNIKTKTLIFASLEDHTIVGKENIPKDVQEQHGRYPELGKKVHAQISHSKLVQLEGVGHIPHIQAFDPFITELDTFLRK
jgi:pimeloyl-ACP methyl ester carboxylesterase